MSDHKRVVAPISMPRWIEQLRRVLSPGVHRRGAPESARPRPEKPDPTDYEVIREGAPPRGGHPLTPDDRQRLGLGHGHAPRPSPLDSEKHLGIALRRTAARIHTVASAGEGGRTQGWREGLHALADEVSRHGDAADRRAIPEGHVAVPSAELDEAISVLARIGQTHEWYGNVHIQQCLAGLKDDRR